MLCACVYLSMYLSIYLSTAAAHLELLVGQEDLEAEEVVLAAQVLLQRVPVSTHVCTYTIAPPRIYACIHAGAAAARTGTPLISCICIH